MGATPATDTSLSLRLVLRLPPSTKKTARPDNLISSEALGILWRSIHRGTGSGISKIHVPAIWSQWWRKSTAAKTPPAPNSTSNHSQTNFANCPTATKSNSFPSAHCPGWIREPTGRRGWRFGRAEMGKTESLSGSVMTGISAARIWSRG